MTIKTKELKTIEEFEALKCGDCLALEYNDKSLKCFTVGFPEINRFGMLRLEHSTTFFNFRKLIKEKSDFVKATLIKSNVNGGKH